MSTFSQFTLGLFLFSFLFSTPCGSLVLISVDDDESTLDSYMNSILNKTEQAQFFCIVLSLHLMWISPLLHPIPILILSFILLHPISLHLHFLYFFQVIFPSLTGWCALCFGNLSQKLINAQKRVSFTWPRSKNILSLPWLCAHARFTFTSTMCACAIVCCLLGFWRLACKWMNYHNNNEKRK